MRKRRYAFTLIELLVVISIMSMLMAIVLPGIKAARQYASKITCRANLHAIGVGFKMYLDENEEILPPAAMRPSQQEELPVAERKEAIRKFLLPYLSGANSLKCPGDVGEKNFESQGSSYEYNEWLGGININKVLRTQNPIFKDAHLMRDYEAFHGREGKKGSFNYLYVDNVISDRKRGKTNDD